MERLSSQQQVSISELSRKLQEAVESAKSVDFRHRGHVTRLAEEIIQLKNRAR